MKSRLATNLVKVLTAAIPAGVLLLASFSIGLSWGVHLAPPSTFSPPTAAERGTPPPPQLAPALTEVPPTALPTPRVGWPFALPKPTPAPVTELAGELDLALINESLSLLKEQFYGELPVAPELTYAILRGFTEQLGDQHTAFLDPEQAKQLEEEMQGHFEGIGARVGEAEGGGVAIFYLFDGQPALRAGLEIGDVIVAVDGADVTGMTLADAIGLVRGPRGSLVTLTIRREELPLFDVTLERARIEIPVVETQSLADGRIAYIALGEFSGVAAARVESALREAVAADPEGLVLDLRGNPGGLLDSAVKIGSFFVPQGPILVERFRDGAERLYERSGPYLLSGLPLVVLIDGGSASASEIVAGAIQDSEQGILLGEKSYGKGSVQLPNALSDGSQLRITIARWFTPLGRAIHGVGLEPDIEVVPSEQERRAGEDVQLDRALEQLLDGATAAERFTPRAVT